MTRGIVEATKSQRRNRAFFKEMLLERSGWGAVMKHYKNETLPKYSFSAFLCLVTIVGAFRSSVSFVRSFVRLFSQSVAH